jgi:CheY-like chemotaxis protein
MLVLIADDDPLVLDTLADQVAAMGHEVVAVPDGVQALHLLGEQPYDLLVSDIGMPHNGLVLVAAVGRDFPAMPILVITGQNSPLVRSTLANCGASVIATMNKPVEPATLQLMVDAIGGQLDPAT